MSARKIILGTAAAVALIAAYAGVKRRTHNEKAPAEPGLLTSEVQIRCFSARYFSAQYLATTGPVQLKR